MLITMALELGVWTHFGTDLQLPLGAACLVGRSLGAEQFWGYPSHLRAHELRKLGIMGT